MYNWNMQECKVGMVGDNQYIYKTWGTNPFYQLKEVA